MDFKFDKKNVIVTGGGSGLGAKIAEEFAKAGANVIVVDINLDENADYKVCIYEDASKLIYNDESLEKALPKPWESEKNIWLFLQDHQEPKWRKLIRKNHRIQEVWNQRTMLTVPL